MKPNETNDPKPEPIRISICGQPEPHAHLYIGRLNILLSVSELDAVASVVEQARKALRGPMAGGGPRFG